MTCKHCNATNSDLCPRCNPRGWWSATMAAHDRISAQMEAMAKRAVAQEYAKIAELFANREDDSDD